MVRSWYASENMKTYSDLICMVVEKVDPTKDPRWKKLTKNQKQGILDAVKTMSDEGRLKKLVNRAFRIHLPDEPSPEEKNESEKIYDEVKAIFKNTPSMKFNLSTTSGWKQYYNTLFKKLDKKFPGKVPIKALNRIGDDRPFTFRKKRYNLQTGFDEWEYITDIITGEKK